MRALALAVAALAVTACDGEGMGTDAGTAPGTDAGPGGVDGGDPGDGGGGLVDGGGGSTGGADLSMLVVETGGMTYTGFDCSCVTCGAVGQTHPSGGYLEVRADLCSIGGNRDNGALTIEVWGRNVSYATGTFEGADVTQHVSLAFGARVGDTNVTVGSFAQMTVDPSSVTIDEWDRDGKVIRGSIDATYQDAMGVTGTIRGPFSIRAWVDR